MAAAAAAALGAGAVTAGAGALRDDTDGRDVITCVVDTAGALAGTTGGGGGSTTGGGGTLRSGGTSDNGVRPAGFGGGVGGLADAACRSMRRRWIPRLWASISRSLRRMSAGPEAAGGPPAARISVTSHCPFIITD